VIDWDEAMEQCGDDEEFLRELLADLRGEVDTQLVKIDDTLKNPGDNPYHRIMRASHVIKGAASNLMCQQLRATATTLEQAAAGAQDMGQDASAMATVQNCYNDLKVAVSNYHAFLQSIGI